MYEVKRFSGIISLQRQLENWDPDLQITKIKIN